MNMRTVHFVKTTTGESCYIRCASQAEARALIANLREMRIPADLA